MIRVNNVIAALKGYQHYKIIGKAVSVSALNQAVSSGTNFAFVVFLVRMLSPYEFGLYGIGITIILFYVAIGNALFLVPMVVHTPEKVLEERPSYAARILILISYFIILSIIVLGIIGMLVGYSYLGTLAKHSPLINAVITASIASLLKEFYIRHAYTIRKEMWALYINITLAFVMLISTGFQYMVSGNINVELAFWIYALANMASALTGYLLSRLPVKVSFSQALVADFHEAWHGGKWAAISTLIHFSRIQAHTIVTVALMGPVGLAALNAARLLVTPAIMLTPALIQIAMPRLAAARIQSEHKAIKLGWLTSFILFIIALIYSVGLLSKSEFFESLVLGIRYTDITILIYLWCLYTLVAAVRSGIDMTAVVFKRFQRLTVSNAAGAIVALLSTYLLVSFYHLPGALLGTIVGEIVVIFFLYSHFAKSKAKGNYGSSRY